MLAAICLRMVHILFFRVYYIDKETRAPMQSHHLRRRGGRGR